MLGTRRSLRAPPERALETLVHDPFRFVLDQPTNIAFLPGTQKVVAANFGERFLSVFEHDRVGAPVPRPTTSTPPTPAPPTD